ncbi:hypothetical protein ACK2SD_12295 [Pseudomonas sp. SC11]|uniref:hypothetical protein n=1 Tax=Pseudomonas sp. SC11 TaxID=326927 RepID=UPI00399A290B
MATSDTVFGMVYSPTWTTWSPPYSNSGPQAQFSDSDFFNDSFEALWNTGQDTSSNAYRNDIGVIGSFGFNLVRLYDWGATRGWNGTYGAAHIGFLVARVYRVVGTVGMNGQGACTHIAYVLRINDAADCCFRSCIAALDYFPS